MLFGRSNNKNNATEELARALSSVGGDAYVLIRVSDLYPVYVSDTFETLTGISKDRFVDDPEVVYRLLSEERRLAAQRELREWADSCSSEPLVVEAVITPQGQVEQRHVRVRFAATAKDGYLLVTIADIAPEIARLDAMQAKINELTNDSSVKTDFLNTMSHEIRTPLNGIIGMLGLARDHVDEKDELMADLEKIGDLSSYLRELVNNILDFSRLESGKVELEHLPFSIVDMVGDVRTMFSGNAADKGVNYTCTTSVEHPYVLGDRLRLSQVVINLVSNALKFTPAGGSVDVDCREMYFNPKDGRGHYMISVRDTGKGIAPEALGKIFRPFEQEDSSIAKSYGGSGLGVSIADQLTSLMGGEITVDSILGKGSDFVIRVPFEVSSEAVETSETKASSDIDWTRLHMLLVEDNDINAKIALNLLSKIGVSAERVGTGEEAVEKVRSQTDRYYDVILMDVGLPGMDGWETTRVIRKMEHERADGGSAVILALSANAYVEDKRHSIEVGMDGHIAKPLDFNELKALVAQKLSE